MKYIMRNIIAKREEAAKKAAEKAEKTDSAEENTEGGDEK